MLQSSSTDGYAIPRFDPEQYDPVDDKPTGALLGSILALFVQDQHYLKSFRPSVRLGALFGADYARHVVGQAILDYYDRYGVPPNVTALEVSVQALKSRDEKVHAAWGEISGVVVEIFDSNLAGSIGLARDLINTVGLYEGYKEYLEKSLALLQGKKRSAETYLKAEEYWQEFRRIGRNLREGGSSLLSLEHAKQRAQDRVRDMRKRVPTGYHALDRALKGGFGIELVYAVAPWKTGKTLFQTNLAFNMLFAGYSVLVFSFEEGEAEFLSRMDQLIYGCSYDNLARIPKKMLALLEELSRGMTSDVRVKWFPSDAVKVSELYSHLERLRETDGFFPDIVMVDGGSLALPERSRDRDHLEQGSVALQYRNYAKLSGLPWFISDQAQREAKGSADVRSGHVGGSVKKVQVADVVITLSADDKDRKKNWLRVAIDEARRGRSRVKAVYQIDPDSSRLREQDDAS